MRATRRFWTASGLGLAVGIYALVLARPLLLVASGAIGAWLVTRQFVFYRAMAEAVAGLSIDQTVAIDRVETDDRVAGTLSASMPGGSPVDLTIKAAPPAAATGTPTASWTVELPQGQSRGETSFILEWQVPGSFQFGQPGISASDRFGLFTERFDLGPTPRVTIEPRAPIDVHVGRGGQRLGAVFGEYPSGSTGPGIEPTGVREYVPGDSSRTIDWNVTARLNEPHVLEFEMDTDRESILLFDQRSRMDLGAPGKTQLDYLRMVALALLDNARTRGNPIGLFLVGNAGLTAHHRPRSTPDGYESIRRQLHHLEAMGPAHPVGPVDSPNPVRARVTADRLSTTDGSFSTTLEPLFRVADPYLRPIRGDPMFEAIRGYRANYPGRVWWVLFTDDSDPPQVRETVKLARGDENHVRVFLTPRVLFEPGSLGDLESAYNRYREFEAFRRDLSGLSRVAAFEVAPGDRLDAILEPANATAHHPEG